MFAGSDQRRDQRVSVCMMYDVILTAQVCTVDQSCDEHIEYSGTRERPDLPGNHEVTNIQQLAEL